MCGVNGRPIGTAAYGCGSGIDLYPIHLRLYVTVIFAVEFVFSCGTLRFLFEGYLEEI